MEVEKRSTYAKSHDHVRWCASSRDEYDHVFAALTKRVEEFEKQRRLEIEARVSQAASSLPTLDENDDEFVAPSTDAITFAKELLSRMLDVASTAFVGSHFDSPELEPTAAGGVDLHWRTDRVELLIAVPADRSKAITFYGDVPGTDTVIKGTLSPNERVRFLADWLIERA